MKYQLAIFDMDGTILDTLEDLWTSVNYALTTNHLPERSRDEVRSFLGNGIQVLIGKSVPEGTSEEITRQVFDTFNPYYKEHCADKTKPYDGIPEVISELRKQGVKTAVVSNKADYGVQILCRDYFPGLFDYAVGEKAGVRRKPYPDSVETVLKELKIEKKDAVYIGDSEVDYETGIQANMDVLMVSWGFRSEEYLKECGASYVLAKPEEILREFK